MNRFEDLEKAKKLHDGVSLLVFALSDVTVIFIGEAGLQLHLEKKMNVKKISGYRVQPLYKVIPEKCH